MIDSFKLSKNDKIVLSPLIIVTGEDKKTIFFKKGNREVLIECEEIDQAELIINILKKTNQPISISRLIKSFTSSQKIFIQIIERLIELKILLKVDVDISQLIFSSDFDNALDNFFWEKEVEWPEFLKYKDKFAIRIIGNNQLSFLIKNLFKELGFSDVFLVDYPYLTDNFSKKHNNDILKFEDLLSSNNIFSTLNIVADAYGNIPSLIQLNKIFLDRNIPFLSLFILSQIGYVGPLVVPNKTSCLDCFFSNLEQTQGNLNVTNSSESEFFKWQEKLYPHPNVIGSLAHFFTFQLISRIRTLLEKKERTNGKDIIFQYKNYCNKVTEVDLITPKIIHRSFLKRNNCPSCCDINLQQKIVFNFRKTYNL